MQTTLENNCTKFRNKISSQFWEIAIFVGGVFSRTLLFVTSFTVVKSKLCTSVHIFQSRVSVNAAVLFGETGDITAFTN